MQPILPVDRLRSIASKAATLLMTYPWKLWFWGDSIGLEGLLDAAELTGDEKYLGYVYGLLKGWIARESHRSEFDCTAAGAALVRVFERTHDPALLDAAVRHSDYLCGFRRSDPGAYVRYENAAFERPPELPADHPESTPANGSLNGAANLGPCVFVDSVHFDGPFFGRMYQVTGEDKYRQLALDNILPQIELLFDNEHNLFHHFWMERARHCNGVFWGRGTGWGILGLVQTLEYLGETGLATARLVDVFRRVAARLGELQDASGGWHTVLSDPTSYVETSIAAFAVDAFSRALSRHWIDEKPYGSIIEAALRFLLSRMRADGLLQGVSYETFPSTRIEHYRGMPRNALVPWGQGPLLAALWSYDQLCQ